MLQLGSYGGRLRYTIQYESRVDRPLGEEYDMIVKGQDMTVHCRARAVFRAGQDIAVELEIKEENCERPSRTSADLAVSNLCKVSRSLNRY